MLGRGVHSKFFLVNFSDYLSIADSLSKLKTLSINSVSFRMFIEPKGSDHIFYRGPQSESYSRT